MSRMSNSQKVRYEVLARAGYALLVKCKSCQHVNKVSECNNLQCPMCGGSMVERGWLPPQTDHYFDGTRQHESASYEGTVYACACGERFVDKNDLLAHIG